MSDEEQLIDELYRGLAALKAEAFPKRCASCGRIYHDSAQFLRETVPVRSGKSGLKRGYDDTDRSLVEVYRNCACGSTMLEFFADRRDTSEQGLRRREIFGQLLERLERAGVDRAVARAELIGGLRGQAVDLEALIAAVGKAGKEGTG